MGGELVVLGVAASFGVGRCEVIRGDGNCGDICLGVQGVVGGSNSGGARVGRWSGWMVRRRRH